MTSVLKHGDRDMTAGSIPRLLIAFAIPLLIGNMFQQFYNTVDSIVVGNYVNKQALAAVGCTGPIINAFIGFFGGLASGAGVVISQYYGAKNDKSLQTAVHTTVAMSLIMCVALTFLGVWLTTPMLRLMDTPPDVFNEATEYLRIYFWGVSGLLIYNVGAAILRAVGDSASPLYFLILSALTNTVLDIVFVKYMNMGIAGAAIATIIAQGISAVLVMLMLMRAKGAYRVNMRSIRLDIPALKKILIIGIPTALQLAITAFSNVFVQSYINHFESSCMAGWAAYTKIDSFAGLPMMSLSVALSTFVGQNLGAGKLDRAKAAPRYGLIIGWTIMLVVLTPMMIFAPQLVSLFNQDAEVLQFGSFFIRVISPFYLALAINQVYSGSLRGAGDTKSSMIIMLGSFVVFRQIYLFIVYRLGGDILPIALSYPAGWILCSISLLVYYYCSGWMKKLTPGNPEIIK